LHPGGRIRAAHYDVVIKQSFIVGKVKGVTCFTGREAFHTGRKRRRLFISGWFYTTLNLEVGRYLCHYLAPMTLEPGEGAGHVTWFL
jgi:hypothetical protein